MKEKAYYTLSEDTSTKFAEVIVKRIPHQFDSAMIDYANENLLTFFPGTFKASLTKINKLLPGKKKPALTPMDFHLTARLNMYQFCIFLAFLTHDKTAVKASMPIIFTDEELSSRERIKAAGGMPPSEYVIFLGDLLLALNYSRLNPALLQDGILFYCLSTEENYSSYLRKRQETTSANLGSVIPTPIRNTVRRHQLYEAISLQLNALETY
ncbi:MAG: hypothetical protein PHP50_11490 [Lachnospiraceae bacterium]|nr:hypothetical protein [Lachnospiraceae bacterium]